MEKGVKNHCWGKNITFLLSGREREKEREREGEKKNRNFSLRFTKFRLSEFIKPRTKVHLLEEGYARVPKTKDFAKDPSEEFGKSKVSGLGSVHGTS